MNSFVDNHNRHWKISLGFFIVFPTSIETTCHGIQLLQSSCSNVFKILQTKEALFPVVIFAMQNFYSIYACLAILLAVFQAKLLLIIKPSSRTQENTRE
jgi:hypothetical protein